MTTIISKKDFLADSTVNQFSNYLTRLFDNEIEFKHGYFHVKNKKQYQFISLKDALIQYDWNGSYDENKVKLDSFAENLKLSLTQNDPTLAYNISIKVLSWGGVLNGNKETIDGLYYDETLISLFKQISIAFTKEPLQVDKLKGIPMNSGFTKIYSLILDDFIIYDSRVGAALGLLVRNFLELNNIEKVPDYLNFAYGVKKGESGFSSRNPSIGNLQFERLSNNNVLHSINNLKANWILSNAFKNQKNKNFKSLREIESALFMIGYSVIESNFASLKHSKSLSQNKGQKAENEEPIWMKLRNTVENLTGRFTSLDLKNKYRELYGDINQTTLNTYITAFTVNSKSRIHYSYNKKPRTCNIEFDFLFRNEDNTLEKFKKEIHGEWLIQLNSVGELEISKNTNQLKQELISQSDNNKKVVLKHGLDLNEIPSGLSWSANIEFALTFKAIEYLGSAEIALNLANEAEFNFWQTGRINEDLEIDVLRSILNTFVNLKRFDAHNAPSYRDIEFMKAIVQAIYNEKHSSMWDNYRE
jgi:hypothetical protein